MRRVVLIAGLVPALTACPGKTECNDIAWPAVVVSVVDSQGDPRNADRLSYSYEGGEFVELSPDSDGHYLVWGDPGFYEFFVEDCSAEYRADIEISGNECGVDSGADNDVLFSLSDTDGDGLPCDE